MKKNKQYHGNMKIIQINTMWFKLPDDFDGDSDAAIRLMAEYMLTPKPFKAGVIGKPLNNQEAWERFRDTEDLKLSGNIQLQAYENDEWRKL